MKGTSLALLAALAAPAFLSTPAQSQETLTRVQLLALQQQMRDDGCHVKHVTGEYDAPTKKGIECEKKRLGVTGGALDVLYAMNIGFGCAPERTDELVKEALAEVERLRTDGPTEQQVMDVREKLLRDFETNSKQNGYWTTQLSLKYQYGEAPDSLFALPIEAFCRRHHIRKLAFFGSVLRDDFTPESDVDVLVEFEPGHTPGLAFFAMQRELSGILGRKVDMNTAQSLSPYFRQEVLDGAEVLYVAADPASRVGSLVRLSALNTSRGGCAKSSHTSTIAVAARGPDH